MRGFVLLLIASACASGEQGRRGDGASALPREVVEFVERRDRCDHFRGEEPYDADRAREIAAALTKSCRGTDAELARLKARYAGAPEVVAALAGYEDRIE